jgi:hypothetical protein
MHIHTYTYTYTHTHTHTHTSDIDQSYTRDDIHLSGVVLVSEGVSTVYITVHLPVMYISATREITSTSVV